MYLIAMLIDISNSGVLVFKNNANIDDISIAIFSAQVTISILVISIMALLTSFINRKYLGVAITVYVMVIEPPLKHRYIIFLELFLIALSGMFLLNGFYTSLVFSFMISLVLVWIMTYNIVLLFENDNNRLEMKIKKYLEDTIIIDNSAYSSVLKYLEEDINQALIREDYWGIKENIEFHEKLYLRLLSKEKGKNAKEFMKSYIRNCNKTLEKKDIKYLHIILDSIQQIYIIANEYEERLELWENVEKNVFVIPLDKFISQNLILSYSRSIWDNIKREYLDKATIDYYEKVYYYSFEKSISSFTNKEKEVLLVNGYKIISQNILADNFDIELFSYTKVLFDNNENCFGSLFERLLRERKEIRNKAIKNKWKYALMLATYYYYIDICVKKKKSKKLTEIQNTIIAETAILIIDNLRENVHIVKDIKEDFGLTLEKIQETIKISSTESYEMIVDLIIFTMLQTNEAENYIREFLDWVPYRKSIEERYSDNKFESYFRIYHECFYVNNENLSEKIKDFKKIFNKNN